MIAAIYARKSTEEHGVTDNAVMVALSSHALFGVRLPELSK